jgi:hypothetical protein
LYDVLPLLYEYALTELQLSPFALTGRVTNLPQGSFPSGAAAGLTAASAARVSYIQPNPPRNYVMQWNLNIQQSLPGETTAMVGYVGSRGIHQLFRGDDMNEVMPTLTPAGYLWPASGGKVLNPNFGRIDVSLWNSNSAYDALQAQVQKRIRKSLHIQGSYTFAKSIDDGSGSALGDPFSNSISNLVWFDSRARRGLSDFNVKHNLVINYIWDLPSPGSSKPVLARYALGGWQLGGVFQARTGLPFTPLIGGDPLGTKDASPFDYPNRITTGSGCGSAVTGKPSGYINVSCFTVPNPITLMGNAGRNSLIGPGLQNVDFSIFKNNYVPRLSENFNVQFRAEFFNVLNHANFNPPTNNLALFDQTGKAVSGAGLIDSTSTTAREIQVALKVIF